MSLGRGSYCKSKISSSIKIGNYSSIAEDVYFHAPGDNHRCVFNKNCVYTTNWNQTGTVSESEVGSDVWIGRGVRVLPGVKIGDGAIIGAYSVIRKDIPPFSVVKGNPAKIKGMRFNQNQVDSLNRIKWWDWPDEKINSAKEDMEDIDSFINKYE